MTGGCADAGPVHVTFDGRPVAGRAPARRRPPRCGRPACASWRTTRAAAAPRGLFCGIGACFDCLVTVDGSAGGRACVTRPARATRSATPARWTCRRWPSRRRDRYDVAVVGAGPAGLAAAVDRGRWAGCGWRCSTRRPGRAASTGGTGRDSGRRRGRCTTTGRRPTSTVEDAAVDVPHGAHRSGASSARTAVRRARAARRPQERARSCRRADRPRHRRLRPGAAVPRLGPARRGHAPGGPGPAQGLGVVRRARGSSSPAPGRSCCRSRSPWPRPGARWSRSSRPATRRVRARIRAPSRPAGKLGEAARLRGARWPAHRIPYRAGQAVRRGPRRPTGVEPRRPSPGSTADWRSGRHRATVACDALAVGYGFTPQLDLALQLGCATRATPTAAWSSRSTSEQAPGARGVRGRRGHRRRRRRRSPWSRARSPAGRAPPAGRHRTIGLLRAARTGCARSPRAHARGAPVRPGWLDLARRRHAGVPLRGGAPPARSREAAGELGADDARTVKLLARAGHGLVPGPGVRATRVARPRRRRARAGPAPVARPVTARRSLGPQARRRRPTDRRGLSRPRSTARNSHTAPKETHDAASTSPGTASWSRRRCRCATTSASTSTRTPSTSAAWPSTGCDGVVPNGSLGEYQTLTDEERAEVVAGRGRGAPAASR